MEKVWRDTASSEMRLYLMDSLRKIQVGFSDVENFRVGLIFTSKTINCDEAVRGDDRKVVTAAMDFKRKDEVRNRRKLIGQKNDKLMEQMEKSLGKKNNKLRRLIRHLSQITETTKAELKTKYDKKIEHLKWKYKEDREKQLDVVPRELEEYRNLAVFDQTRFNDLEVENIEVVKYGDVKTSEDEDSILRLHPKMSIRAG